MILAETPLESDDRALIEHYLERNETRLDWATTSNHEQLRKKKAETLGLHYEPARAA